MRSKSADTLKRAPLVFILLFAFASFCNAQLAGTNLARQIQSPGSKGKVTLVQDDAILQLIDRHLYEESKKNGIVGYRIRLFSDSGNKARKEGELMKANFISRYGKMNTYFLFDSPFYLLYVGDFRTHSEAMKFLKQIEPFYPDAFIVRSKINYPSL